MDFIDFSRQPPNLDDKVFLFDVFCRFGAAQVESWDIDPTYPVLERIYDLEEVSPNNRLWRTFLYVTFYNLGSSYRVWSAYPEPTLPNLDDLNQPTGIERRGFRARPEVVRRHIESALEVSQGDFVAWVESYGEGEAGWDTARDAMKGLHYGGDWSAYKWADLLLNVHHLPLIASDFGVGGGSETAGPIPGMVILTGHNWKDCATKIDLQKSLFERCREAGAPFRGLDQVETCLCDFNSLVKGRYYMGHDIDAQMGHFRSGEVPGLFWSARDVFPDRYRGERNGWFGVRRGRMRDFALWGDLLL